MITLQQAWDDWHPHYSGSDFLQCVERVSKHLENYGEVRDIVRKQFESLVKGGYIQPVKSLVKPDTRSEQEAEVGAVTG